MKIDEKYVQVTVISNSAIYGMIRQNAREAIEKGIAADRELARRTAAVRAAWAAPPPLATPGNLLHSKRPLHERVQPYYPPPEPTQRRERLRPITSPPARTCETT